MTVEDRELVNGLGQLIQSFLGDAELTRDEKVEVFRIAAGCYLPDSAAHAGVSQDEIRIQRNRIFRKLDIGGSSRLISRLLVHSVAMMLRGETLVGTETRHQVTH